MDLFNLLERTFAREHDQAATQFAGELDAAGAGDRHLRRGMDREIGRKLADQPADANVLHDGGINARRDNRAQILFGFGQFVGKHERIESDITFDAAPVQELHQIRQVGFGEIARAHPGVELLQAEINRIRAVFDGGARAFPIAGRREQFGKAEARRWKAAWIRQRLDVVLLGNRIVRTVVHQQTGS